MNLIVCGSTGRMGSQIIAMAQESGQWGKIIGVNRQVPLAQVIGDGEVVIDFTLPEAIQNHLELAVRHRRPIVIGTTGLNAAQENLLKESAKKVPIVFSPNMALGVNLLFALIQETCKVFGKNIEILIEEKHHIHKKDKPSGTAKAMAAIVAKTLEYPSGKNPEIKSTRKGEIIGEHSITFSTPFEKLTINHIALDRKIFAHGALKAALWLRDKRPGLYSMKDVLELK